MRANTVIIEVVGFLWRYACAILVTLLVWAAVILLGVTIINKGVIEFLSGAHNHPMHPTACFCIAFTAAFWGVQLGGLCLPARSRVFACVALLIMGLAYYMTFWYVSWRHEMSSKHGNDALLIPLAAGGCAPYGRQCWPLGEQRQPVRRWGKSAALMHCGHRGAVILSESA